VFVLFALHQKKLREEERESVVTLSRTHTQKKMALMAIPLDLLDDLCTRFLLNVPAHELE
jgi:hypothetical protein